MDKINEIEKRMDYVIDNWQSDSQIPHQEIRFTIVAYLYGLYKNKKVKDLAKAYLQRIDEKSRLDSGSLLTAIAAALVVHKDFSEYWIKLKTRINKSSSTEKYNLIIKFLTILTTNVLKRIEDEIYIKALLEELKNQDTEKGLFSYWTEKRLFSIREKMSIPQAQIKHLKEYLLWEAANLEEYGHKKEELREKFIPEMLNYKVDRVDWIAFLIYQFLKRNKPITITETELKRKIKHEVKKAITKKVWFPLICSMIFVLVKFYRMNAISGATISQILMLIFGTLFSGLEESLPSFKIPIKKYKIGEILMVAAILWALGLTTPLEIIKKVLLNLIRIC